MKDFNVHVSRQATIHSSRIFISYFHLSRKLKALNPVSRNNPFHPLLQRFFCLFIYLFIYFIVDLDFVAVLGLEHIYVWSNA